MKELNKFRDFLNENKADVFDYADRIMGAGVDDPIGLIDFYAENPDDIPEPMDAEIFVANTDAIRDRVADYVAMMGEGKDEIDEAMFDKIIQKLKDKRAAKKEKERFTKGLDMKDFRKGAPEIDPEFTAGLEEGTVNEGMYQEVDDMLSKTAVHMKADDFVDELIEELEAMKGAIPFLHKALKTIMANNNIPE